MKIDRKQFLQLFAAASVAPPVRAWPQQASPSADTDGSQQFALRVAEDGAAALRCALCYIGDRLDIFKAMASSGPVSAAQLARKTGLNGRMLREWLNAMAAARYIDYRPGDKTYFLAAERASILADEASSPMFRGGMFQIQVSMVSAAPKVANAFQTGKPLTPDVFSSDLYTGTERAFAPIYRYQLVPKWIPLLPEVQAMLRKGGTAVDVGCGTGLASIVLAKAFPESQFDGYDPYLPSIKQARLRARKENLTDRVHFMAADSSRLPASRYDLVTIFHTAHHLSDPVSVLAHCRRALKPGGTCFVVDFDIPLNPEENMNLVGRVAYSMTTLYCLHDSMANNGAGLGAEFNYAVLERLASESGFSRCRKLPGSTPGQAYYELRA